MKLYMPVNSPVFSFKLDLKSNIVAIGSCFSKYIMEKLDGLGIPVLYNPNGIVYNTYSIKTAIEHIVYNKNYNEDNFIYHNNLWHSWQHHSSFSSSTIQEIKKHIAETNKRFREFITKSELVIITPASSVVYMLKEKNLIVANCHKYPGKYFDIKILSYQDNLYNLKSTVSYIRKINYFCRIIFTLSPVRHYPGDLVLNSRSKSNILSAIHTVINTIPDCHYFPSYEIMMDELRDYRFYNEDMLHPSTLAKKIIFERFISALFTDRAQKDIAIRKSEIKRKNHRTIITKQ